MLFKLKLLRTIYLAFCLIILALPVIDLFENIIILIEKQGGM
jgi:hypothetical protein